MQGEYRGDFTRDTFDPLKHFSRVLMQQGRVQLDADWNEQTSILLHCWQSLAADLIGPHGGPGDGFKIMGTDDQNNTFKNDFLIQGGHYYVDGILCENDAPLLFSAQSGFPFPNFANLEAEQSHLVFLDVWERHITCHEDGDLCEVALGGPDTATRAQIVCQVKVPRLNAGEKKQLQDLVVVRKKAGTDKEKADAMKAIDEFAKAMQEKLITPGFVSLRARAKVAQKPDHACTISPESRYRGTENQLYRVEIQRTGGRWDGKSEDDKGAAATFKWSRDNGSVIFPILTLTGDKAKLRSLGRDSLRRLEIGDWVEIMDDDLALRGQPGPLRQVKDINPDEMIITLGAPVTQTYQETSSVHPLLRRWDQRNADGKLIDGALLLKEDTGEDDKNWIALKDGIQIQFPTPKSGSNTYRAGDYWLIPARVATGDVLWPKVLDNQKPVANALPPHGIDHHYAPLAVITLDGDGKITGDVLDLRRTFGPRVS